MLAFDIEIIFMLLSMDLSSSPSLVSIVCNSDVWLRDADSTLACTTLRRVWVGSLSLTRLALYDDLFMNNLNALSELPDDFFLSGSWWSAIVVISSQT